MDPVAWLPPPEMRNNARNTRIAGWLPTTLSEAELSKTALLTQMGDGKPQTSAEQNRRNRTSRPSGFPSPRGDIFEYNKTTRFYDDVD
jgi:hypothetical protein